MKTLNKKEITKSTLAAKKQSKRREKRYQIEKRKLYFRTFIVK
jgi:hypothetical protein